MSQFNYKKAIQALNVLAIKEGGSINKMKAIKLIWLADRLHLRKYGRPIISDNYYAMKFGPVPSHTKNIIDKNEDYTSDEELIYRDIYIEKDPNCKHSFISKNKPELSVFSKTDIEAILKVYDEFGEKNQFDLSTLSHHFPEWKKSEGKILDGICSRADMNYNDFFDNTDINIELFDQSEKLLNVSKELFTELLTLEYGTC